MSTAELIRRNNESVAEFVQAEKRKGVEVEVIDIPAPGGINASVDLGRTTSKPEAANS